MSHTQTMSILNAKQMKPDAKTTEIAETRDKTKLIDLCSFVHDNALDRQLLCGMNLHRTKGKNPKKSHE